MASPGLTAPLLPDGAASPATPFPAIPTWTPPTSAERERDRRREEAIDRELAELEAERLRGLFELGRDLDLGGSDGGAGDLVATRAGATEQCEGARTRSGLEHPGGSNGERFRAP